MLRKTLATIVIFLISATFAFGQSMTFPVRIAGTTWSGHEDLGGYGPLRFAFSGSSVTMYDSDGSHSGSWSQSGNTITMRFYQGRVVYTGRIHGQAVNYKTSFLKNDQDFYVFHVGVACNGPTIEGTAHNGKGKTWNWNVSMPAIPIQVTGTYDGAYFGFRINLFDGRGTGEAILRREHPDDAKLTWNMTLAQP
ncbi:MAG: hypothetical protein FJ303_24660 [Planctomycetes bacterium]|nr:hypothetical protein [Planctomycetota bacterium]